jgi:hypothetical protein
MVDVGTLAGTILRAGTHVNDTGVLDMGRTGMSCPFPAIVVLLWSKVQAVA